MTVAFKKLNPQAVIPAYAHPGDAGMDLSASEPVDLQPGEYAMVPTGLAIELPSGTEAQVRPRSGLAAKHGVTVLNAPGTIDEGYRGEIKVILINHGKEIFRIAAGMRIAQLVIAQVLPVDIKTVEALSGSERGDGGFGSTGTM
jgi:dUTP pyrophosphatase